MRGLTRFVPSTVTPALRSVEQHTFDAAGLGRLPPPCGQPFPVPPPQPLPLPEGGGDRNATPLYVFPNAEVMHHFLPDMRHRIDIPAKVTRGAGYVQDMRPPRMLHARVVLPPSYGAQLRPADIDGAAKTPGVVEVIHDGNFLAVVATREFRAIKAMRMLAASAEWDETAKLPIHGNRRCIRRRRSGGRAVREASPPRRRRSLHVWKCASPFALYPPSFGRPGLGETTPTASGR